MPPGFRKSKAARLISRFSARVLLCTAPYNYILLHAAPYFYNLLHTTTSCFMQLRTATTCSVLLSISVDIEFQKHTTQQVWRFYFVLPMLYLGGISGAAEIAPEKGNNRACRPHLFACGCWPPAVCHLLGWCVALQISLLQLSQSPPCCGLWAVLLSGSPIL